MIPTRDADAGVGEPANGEPANDEPPNGESLNGRAENDGTTSVDGTLGGAAIAEPETPEDLAAQWEAQGPPPAGGIANACASLVTLGLGVFGLVAALSLGVGSPTQPAAGFFPFCMAAVVVVLSVVQLIIGRRGGDGEKFGPEAWTTFFGFTSMFAFIALLPIIGFEIPGLLLSFVWMKLLGGESWRSAILYSVIVVAAFYVIFVVALSTRIPHLF